MSAEIDPKEGNGYPHRKYPSGEMVYATELESAEKARSCGFESHLGYHLFFKREAIMQTQKELDRMESDWEARWEDEYQEYLESLDEEDDEDEDDDYNEEDNDY